MKQSAAGVSANWERLAYAHVNTGWCITEAMCLQIDAVAFSRGRFWLLLSSTDDWEAHLATECTPCGEDACDFPGCTFNDPPRIPLPDAQACWCAVCAKRRGDA